MNKPIRGFQGAGGKGGDTPTEAPDTIITNNIATVIDLISEGECEGLVDGRKSIFYNEVAWESESGAVNFTGVTLNVNNGLPDQSALPGFDDVKSSVSVTQELPYNTYKTISFPNDGSVTAVIVTIGGTQFFEVKDDGDTVGSAVSFVIELSENGGSFTQVYSGRITGKQTSDFSLDYRITVADPTGNTAVRVKRTTAEGDSLKVNNTINFKTYTKVVELKLAYPNCAVAGHIFDAKQFGSQVPTRQYRWRGIKCRIPTNYDPVTRTYTGPFTGAFTTTKYYTNNPAYQLYELLTNRRFGLGQFMDANLIDIPSIYMSGKWCDELTSDGKGGQEPRWTCNTQITSRGAAFDLINQLMSCFRGTLFWMQAKLWAVGDSPRIPVKIVTNANVVDGKFSYTGESNRQRYSVVNVTFNDPDVFYRKGIEPVEDGNLIRELGYKPTDFAGFGCTSRAQAHRLGQAILYAQEFESELVSYSASFDHMAVDGDGPSSVAPGDMILIADRSRGNAVAAGRIVSASGAEVVLDRNAGTGSGTVYLEHSDGTIEWVTCTYNGTALHMTQTPVQPVANNDLFILVATGYDAEPFVVLKVAENGSNLLDISAVRYDEGRFAAIYGDVNIDPGKYMNLPSPEYVIPPTDLALKEGYITNVDLYQRYIDVTWVATTDTLLSYYQVAYSKDNGVWQYLPISTSTSARIDDVRSGSYEVRLTAVNRAGRESQPLYETINIDVVPDTDTLGLGSIANLKLETDGSIFSGRDAKFVWEIQTPQGKFLTDSGVEITDVGMVDPRFRDCLVTIKDSAGITLRTESVIGTHYTYTYEKNFEDNDGVPTREITIAVQYRDQYGRVSSVTSFDAENEAPEFSTDPSVTAGLDGVTIDYQRPTDLDFLGTKIYVSLTSPVSLTSGNLRYEGASNHITIPQLAPGVIHYVVVVPEDAFGDGTPTGTLSSTPLNIFDQISTNTDAIEATYAIAIANAAAIADEATTRAADIATEATARADGIAAEAAARSAEILSVSTTLQANIDTLAAQVADLTSTPYDNTVTYHAGDVVSYSGKLYEAKTTTVGHLPTDATYWDYIGDYTSVGDQVIANTAAISTLQSDVSALEDDVSAAVTATDTLAAQIRGTYTGSSITDLTAGLLYSERVARVTADAAQVSATTALSARMTTAEGNISTQATAITNLTTRVGTAEGAITSNATSITTLASTVALNANTSTNLPSAFSGGLGNWTNSRTGSPTAAAAVSTGSLVTNDSDFGNCYQASFTTIADNILTRGCIPIIAGRVYEITVKFKVTASDGSAGFSIVVAQLLSDYTSAVNSSLGAVTVTTTGTVTTMTAKLSTVAGTGITVFGGTSKLFRYGLRLDTTESGLTFRVGSIECRDVTEGYANATAITGLDTRVTATEGSISSLSTAVTNLTSTVSNKADASALTTLATTVATQGTQISSISTSVTNLSASLSNIGGDNFLKNSSFENSTVTAGLADQWASYGTNPIYSLTPSSLSFSTNAQRVTSLNAIGAAVYVGITTQAVSNVMKVSDTQTVVFSCSSKGDAGRKAHILLQFYGSDGTTSTGLLTSTDLVTAATWKRHQFSTAVPAGSVTCRPYFRVYGPSTGTAITTFDIDNAQLQLGAIATEYQPSAYYGLADAATAIQGLDARVTDTEDGLDSVSTAFTNLTASLTDVGGSNMLYNPSLEETSSTSGTSVSGWSTDNSGATGTYAQATSTLETDGKMVSIVATGLSATTYVGMVTTPVNRPHISAGQSVTASAYLSCSLTGRTYRIYISAKNAAGTEIGSVFQTFNSTTDWQRVGVSYTNLPVGTDQVSLSVRMYGTASATTGTLYVEKLQLEPGSVVTGWRDSNKTLASLVNSTASALTSLTARVTSAEGSISSISTSVTSLTSRMSIAEGNIAAQSTAIGTLTTRITNAEGSISTQSSAITSLTASLNQIGGDNLLDNSSFENDIDADGMADGYNFDNGGGTIVSTLVPSTLPFSTNAQRIVNSALAVNGEIGVNAVSLKAVPGAYYVATGYVRGTTNRLLRIYLRFEDATATPLQTTSVDTVNPGSDFARLSISALAPAGTARARVYYRLRNNTATVSSHFIEVDNVQLQMGSIPTEYRPSVTNVATAVSTLDARMTEAEGDILSTSNSVTSLQASLLGQPNAVSNSTFANGSDGWVMGASTWLAYTTLDVNNGTFAYSATTGGTLVLVQDATKRIPVGAGVSYTLSMDNLVTGFTSGSCRFDIIWRDASAAVVGQSSPYIYSANTGWVRNTITAVAPTGSTTAEVRVYTNGVNAGCQMRARRIKFEKGTFATPYSTEGDFLATGSAITALSTRVATAEGNISTLSSSVTSLNSSLTTTNGTVAGQATAISGLTTRVATAEGNISSLSTSVTSLSSSLADTGGENLVYNPSFETGSGNVSTGWTTTANAGLTATFTRPASTLDGGICVQISSANFTSTAYADVKITTATKIPVTAGETYTASAYSRASNNVYTRIIWQWVDASNTVLSTPAGPTVTGNSAWQRLSLTSVAPAGATGAYLYLRAAGLTASAVTANVYWDRIQFEQGSVATAWRDNIQATADALTALTTTVTTQGGTISSISSSLTTLTTTVGGHTSSISSLQSITSTQTGNISTLMLKAGVVLNANGYMTGWALNNNGSSGSMAILADAFSIVAPSGGARTEYSGGNWRVYDAANVLRVRMGVW